jgi:hypothetical protein
MPRIRCRYIDCIFLDYVYCGAAAVELDPDTGCVTYRPNEEASDKDEDLEEEKLEEWDEEAAEDEEDDTWEEDKDDI